MEITNVGKGGVASEETLAQLLAAMRYLAKKEGFDPKDVAKKTKALSNAMDDSITIVDKHRKALDNNTDSLKLNTALLSKSFGLLGSGVAAATTIMGNFAKEVAFGGNQITDFAKHIPIFGSVITPFTQLIDNNIQTFREFSQIGAQSGAALYEFQKLASAAGLPLADFSQLMMENQQTMRVFGATTSNASKTFARMSKELATGAGKELMQLGYTSYELNELLVKTAEIQQRQIGFDRLRNRTTVQQAAALGAQMMELSAITGKRRDQIADEMSQSMSDIRVKVQTANMSDEQAQRFLANLSLSGDTLREAVIDMADGTIQGDVTAALMNMSETFRNTATDVENLNPEEMTAFVTGVKSDLEAFATSQGTTVEALSKLNPAFAEAFRVIEESRALAEMTPAERAQFIQDQKDAKSRSDAILEFGKTMEQIRGTLAVAFLSSGLLDQVTLAANEFAAFMGDEGTIASIKAGFDDMSSWINGFITEVQTIGWKETITNALSGLGDTIGTTLKDILFGYTTTEQLPGNNGSIEKEIPGIFSNMFDGVGSSILTAMTEGVKEGLSNLTWVETAGIAAAAGFTAIFALAGPIAALKLAFKTLFGLASVSKALITGIGSMMGVGSKGMKDYVSKNLTNDPKGTYRDGKGRLRDEKSNKYVADPNKSSATTPKKPDVDLPDGKNDKWWKKMPKIKGGGGALAAVMGLFTLGSILADDEMSKDEKIVDGTGAAAGTVGGVGGAWAGASAGAMVGAMGGPIGAAIGGILGSLIGGTLGYMAGDTVGSAAAGAVVGDVTKDSIAQTPAAQTSAPPLDKDSNAQTPVAQTSAPPLDAATVRLTERYAGASEGMERIAGAFERIGAITGLRENINALTGEFKTIEIAKFNTQLRNVGESLEKINDELVKDNSYNPFSSGENAGSVLAGNSGQGMSPEQFTELNNNIIHLIGLKLNGNKIMQQVAKNTGSVGTNTSVGDPYKTKEQRTSGRNRRR